MVWSSDEDDPLPALSDEEVDQQSLIAIACEERDRLDPTALASKARDARAIALGSDLEPEPLANRGAVEDSRMVEAAAQASVRRATWAGTQGGVQSKLDAEFQAAKQGAAAAKSEIAQRMETRQAARQAERSARIHSITAGVDSLKASLSAQIDAELELSGKGTRTKASFEEERAAYQQHLADYAAELASPSALGALQARRVGDMDARARDRRMASLQAIATGDEPPQLARANKYSAMLDLDRDRRGELATLGGLASKKDQRPQIDRAQMAYVHTRPPRASAGGGGLAAKLAAMEKAAMNPQ